MQSGNPTYTNTCVIDSDFIKDVYHIAQEIGPNSIHISGEETTKELADDLHKTLKDSVEILTNIVMGDATTVVN